MISSCVVSGTEPCICRAFAQLETIIHYRSLVKDGYIESKEHHKHRPWLRGEAHPDARKQMTWPAGGASAQRHGRRRSCARPTVNTEGQENPQASPPSSCPLGHISASMARASARPLPYTEGSCHPLEPQARWFLCLPLDNWDTILISYGGGRVSKPGFRTQRRTRAAPGYTPNIYSNRKLAAGGARSLGVSDMIPHKGRLAGERYCFTMEEEEEITYPALGNDPLFL